MSSAPPHWFKSARYGLFLHWGPYALFGRGEQVLFREHMDQNTYAQVACTWDPQSYDPAGWAEIAKRSGFKYAVLTARHHDGYCLWDSAFTDYSSAKQAPGRDFVAEFLDAFREAGLKVGLYYSWLDWRLPAFFEGPERNPGEWPKTKAYLHHQVKELMTRYGKIDIFWFDGSWPRSAAQLESRALVARMRKWQPGILINNRLGAAEVTDAGTENAQGAALSSGDFATPEHTIQAEGRMWESCQVANWRLWGYARGERWRPADVLLDALCQCAEQGGNLLLNVGPQGDGQLPEPFVKQVEQIGRWLDLHGEAIYPVDGGDLTEFISHGRQTLREHFLYLIIRFWHGDPVLRVNDLCTPVRSVCLLTTGQELPFEQKGADLYIHGLPAENPSDLFGVIRVACTGRPETNQWGRERNWGGDPQRIADWARQTGTPVCLDGCRAKT
ncbi:MAG: alpha-L-fucosidase [Candidatus Latescibacterota bacterium]